MDLPQFGRRHMCFYVHGREAACGRAYQTEGSHHWLKARQGSAWIWRRAESTMDTLSCTSPTFHFTLTLSSLLFDLPPHGTGEGGGAAGAGNRSAESLDSADHQQLRVDVDRKEMRSRGGRQADAGSCSPTPLGSCLVPCCGPGAAARCRNGVGHPVGSRGLTLEYCAP